MRTIYFTGKIVPRQPLTVILKSAVSSSGHRLPRNGGPSADPYFPGPSIRGALRHAAHQVVVDRVTAENNGVVPFDLADHFMLAQGVDIADQAVLYRPGEIDAGVKIRARNPLLSLFGRWKLTGKVGIGNAMPLGPGQWAMFDGGAHTIMFERDDSLIELLEPEQITRLNRLVTEQADASVDIQSFRAEQAALKKLLKTADKDAAQDLRTEISALDGKIKARKAEKSEARESIRRPVDPFEAFVAGAELKHQMFIKNVTDIEAGLFIATLIRFGYTPQLGSRCGNCRLVDACWEVTSWKPGELEPVSLGEFSITPHGIKITGSEIKAMLKSFTENKDLDFRIY